MADVKCNKCGVIYCDCGTHTCSKTNLDNYRIKLAQIAKQKEQKKELIIKLNLNTITNNNDNV